MCRLGRNTAPIFEVPPDTPFPNFRILNNTTVTTKFTYTLFLSLYPHMATLSPTVPNQYESLPVDTSRAKSCGVTIVLISTNHDRVMIESHLVITSHVKSYCVLIVLISMGHDLVMI